MLTNSVRNELERMYSGSTIDDGGAGGSSSPRTLGAQLG